jgi:hypothetical protein
MKEGSCLTREIRDNKLAIKGIAQEHACKIILDTNCNVVS